MSFHLKHSDSSLEEGVRRIVRSQITSALEEAAALDDPAEAVHSVRKRCKKLRGLVRLVRPGLSGAGARNALFRDAAQGLSGVRDAAVLVETYDKLAKAFPDRLDRAATATVRAHLVDERRAAHVEADQYTERMAVFRATMAGALDEVKDWDVGGKAAETVAEGVERVLQDAAEALKAVRKKATPERVHELRKHVKYHHSHVRLLRELWPGPMKVLADELNTLGELLGDEHDLSVFIDTLSEAPLAPEQTEDVIALAHEHRDRLRDEAMSLADRVFADEPKVVARRIETFWKAWRRGPAPAKVADVDPADADPNAGLEIERKFIVMSDAWRDAVRETMEIRQAYVANTDRVSVRVRIKNGTQATMTVKSARTTMARREIEFKIPLADARALMELATGVTIEKRRHVVPVGAIDVEVDEFVSPEPSLVVAEVELSRPDAPLPVADWLGREVTGNPRYYGASIAGAVRSGE
ncbi:CHAD domain-containing protein [Acuticoccus sediminis]|uniref:CHAD domain-containing protein n=1 Tax=Acuticoccus sediminis TaxID=2184697 RepID=UPI001CFDB9B2|nr:CHAD domain-containing protein [Acuticoccus sediminis]